MSEKEKEVGARLAEALNELELPDTGKEYLIGYAEGLAAMAQKKEMQAAESEAIAACTGSEHLNVPAAECGK